MVRSNRMKLFLALGGSVYLGALILVYLRPLLSAPDMALFFFPLLVISPLAIFSWFFVKQSEKKLREALRETEDTREYLRQVLDSIPTGVVIIDTENRTIVDINDELRGLIGMSRDEIIGSDCKESLCQGAEPCTIQNGEGQTFNGEVLLKRPDGTSIPVLKSVRPVFLRGKKFLLESLVNLSPLREMESALERERAYFRHFFESSPEGIVIFDEKGTVIRSNPGFCELFGFSQEEIVDRSLMELVAPLEEEEEIRFTLSRIFREPQVVSHEEACRRRKDGSLVDVSVVIVPIKEGTSVRFGFSIYRDITERRKVDKLKTEFVSTVSHELRTPLTSIHGSLGLILSGVAGELTPELKSLLGITQKNSERLIGLVNDILDIEKIEVGKMSFQMTVFDLGELARKAIELNRAYGEKFEVDFDLDVFQEKVMVCADRDRLLQVMSNFLSNAAKFSNPGDTVHVFLQCCEGKVCYSVADKGTGIPEEFREKVFQKFTQADSSDTRHKGGTGLGLSISKGIVERHGGQIGFKSNEGPGTTFFFKLPEFVSQRSDAVLGSFSKGLAPKGRILVLEDDPDIAALLKIMLSRFQVEAVLAYTCAEARDFLTREEFQAITVDLMLPGQDGFSFLRELREDPRTRNLPAIVISALAKRGQEEAQGLAFEVIDWIDKPIDERRLYEAIQKVVGSGEEARVLHVEDDSDIVHLVSMMIGDFAEPEAASTLEEARKLIREKDYDLVILDLLLPDGSGIDLLPDLRYSGGGSIPVVVFSALDITREVADQVDRSFVKSRTSYEELIEEVNKIISRNRLG